MLRSSACFAAMLLLAPVQSPNPKLLPDGPAFTADGQLKLPEHYREWIFLTSGLDMSYQPSATPQGSMFDNVFVNPSAYLAYLQTGTWPDGTIIVLENRSGEAAKSINKAGKTQSTEIMGTEAHVKDSAHGGWGFYSFGNAKTAQRIPQAATCYSCHEQHAAVDTTFVQFYPTLQPAAEAHKTWSKSYLAETAKPDAK
jgi:hypothetical protein